MATYYLSHAGIKGMKWGIRRWQRKDGSLTPAGKIRYLRTGKGNDDDDNNDRDESPEDYEARKARALKEGSAEEVLRYKGSLSNKELRDAVDRIDLERRLSSISEQERKTGFDKFTSVMDKVGRTKDALDKGVGLYNFVAKINNSLNDKKLPVLDGQKYEDKSARERLLRRVTAKDVVKDPTKYSTEELSTLVKRMSSLDAMSKKVGTSSETNDDSGDSARKDSSETNREYRPPSGRSNPGPNSNNTSPPNTYDVDFDDDGGSDKKKKKK